MAEMTNEQVRRAIAEALGWHDFQWLGPRNDYLYAIAPAGYDYSTAERPARMQVPDWPNDPGAALALCLGIAARNAWDVDMQYAPDVPESIQYEAHFLDFVEHSLGYDDRRQCRVKFVHSTFGATPAEALARLALAALQGRRD